MYAVFWTSSDDQPDRLVSRHYTREKAEEAANKANEQQSAWHPGADLLCRYEVRSQVGSEWWSDAKIESE